MKKARLFLFLSSVLALSSCSLFSNFFSEEDEVKPIDIIDDEEGRELENPVHEDDGLYSLDNIRPDLNSGYGNVVTTGTSVATANSQAEFERLINQAILERKASIRITSNYNHTVPKEHLFELAYTTSFAKVVAAGTYQTGTGVTNDYNLVYDFVGLDESNIASDNAQVEDEVFTPTNEYTNLVNANFVNRRARFNKRGALFTDFEITYREHTLPVYNSDDLWYCVSIGCRPDFQIENSKAEAMYKRAKAICKEYISDDMNKVEKYQTLYDYVCSYADYDFDALNYTSPWQLNTAYFLEGVMQYNYAVCDGLSKLFALLCGIEGISVKRAFGYPSEENTGHAWNYVKINNVWYLVCTTWGQRVQRDGLQSLLDYPFEYTSYDPFGTTSTYFYDEDQREYIQYSAPETRTGETAASSYWDISTDLITYNVDYYVSKATELRDIFLNTKPNVGNSDFTITLRLKKGITIDSTMMRSYLIGAGISGKCLMTTSESSLNGYTIIFVDQD